MLRVLSWIELLVSIPLLLIVPWSLSRACTGRPIGFDCEAWAIFGINMFGPIGLLMLIGSAWSLKSEAWAAQYIIVVGCAAVGAWWFFAYINTQQAQAAEIPKPLSGFGAPAVSVIFISQA